ERFGERVQLVVDDITEALRAYPIDANCYVVIATRGHLYDQQALNAVIHCPAGYVGMIGSRKKSVTILDALASAGVSRELLDRVHTPIGISIGAVTVNEIAVSIAAELIQLRRQTTPRAIEGPLERSP
ncbi:MAG: XdhC family protein, partial [Planctomycetes bacterium]|nr:XdhC family protein [Planctomycetota bacterium]